MPFDAPRGPDRGWRAVALRVELLLILSMTIMAAWSALRALLP